MSGLNRRGVLLAVGLGLVLVAASAGAERTWRLPKPAPPFSVVLETGDGAALPTFRHAGSTFVLGERGERYAIRIDNPTAERVEAVISVDGRDAISGRVADYRAQRGYIVPPHGSIRIEGFRRSLDDVATFRFSTPADSYSARRGTPENVGVIGVAFFRERTPARIVHPRPFPRVSADDEVRSRRDLGASEERAERPEASRKAGGSASAPAPRGRARRDYERPAEDASNLGTEYGERRDSSVYEVAFVRRNRDPDRLTTLRYDDAAGLERRGIDIYPWRHRERPIVEPDPFPASRFAEPPP